MLKTKPGSLKKRFTAKRTKPHHCDRQPPQAVHDGPSSACPVFLARAAATLAAKPRSMMAAKPRSKMAVKPRSKIAPGAPRRSGSSTATRCTCCAARRLGAEKDETCPLSTGGRTRRVQLVQGEGGGNQRKGAHARARGAQPGYVRWRTSWRSRPPRLSTARSCCRCAPLRSSSVP